MGMVTIILQRLNSKLPGGLCLIIIGTEGEGNCSSPSPLTYANPPGRRDIDLG